MSLVITGGVALAYATGVVGLHRYALFRRRASAQGYQTLRWLDWDLLLAGVLPREPAEARPDRECAPVEGGPTPRVLQRAGGRELEALSALVRGDPIPPEAFEEAGFSGADVRWLGLLSELREAPLQVLEAVTRQPPASVAEAALHEWLVAEYEVTALNLELATFSAKRRLKQLFQRFGNDQPALYFARARASAQLGFTGAVLDDLARAVYFSREAPFYLAAVTQLPFIEEARPALMRVCVEGLRRSSGAKR